MTYKFAAGCTLLFRKEMEAVFRQCIAVGKDMQETRHAISGYAAQCATDEVYLGVEDVFSVGGPFGEGVLLGFRSLVSVHSLKKAKEYRDLGADNSEASTGWLIVRLVYWIPLAAGPLCIEADMAMRATSSPATFTDRLFELEYGEMFFDPLVDALALTPSQVEKIQCVGVRDIEPIAGEPEKSGIVLEVTQLWSDSLLGGLLSEEELEEKISDVGGVPDEREARKTD